MPRTSVRSFFTLVVFAAPIVSTTAITASAQIRNRIAQNLADTEPAMPFRRRIRWPGPSSTGAALKAASKSITPRLCSSSRPRSRPRWRNYWRSNRTRTPRTSANG